MIPNCTPALEKGWSVARYWDEEALTLVRANPPAPTIVARNLFDLSAVMWDAWAAYDPVAVGYFSNEKSTSADLPAARNAAISYAAYALIAERYFGNVANVPDDFKSVLTALCYRTLFPVLSENTPPSIGRRIAAAAIKAGLSDGSLESNGYSDPSFAPVNDPIRPSKPGTVMNDPNKWQPIQYPAGSATGQGGKPAPDVQSFIGAQWGHVTPFALPVSSTGVAIDPGPPPALGADAALTAEYKQDAIRVLTYSSTLDAGDGVTEDVSPASVGDSTLGTNDGHGRDVNPVTNEPYEPDVVLTADYERSLAEFWADGPTSETPPGHWNLIANSVSDTMAADPTSPKSAAVGDRLQWDVKLYFALNGSLHDAAIAAWGLKREYDSARPISMIRFMAGLGQSTDPSAVHYNPDGLPLVPGLVELVTKESAAKGERHYDLRDHIGEIAVHAWRGFPKDPTTETSGVGWILGVDWVPYQRPSFITPSFPGYVSGHSTFSRAAAEVLTGITGSEFFPGGLSRWEVPIGALKHEVGPSAPVQFQWATYYDAADSAGLSRLYMGIHTPEDDFEGRKIGAECGTDALALAGHYFDGSAEPPQT